MEFKSLLFEMDHGVARITLNRPESLNSLDERLLRDLIAAADECAVDDQVKAVLLTGAGRAFCAGADLMGAITENTPEARSAYGQAVKQAMDELFNPVVSKLAHLEKPVVTAVNGIAAGGGVGLALTGDLVLAAESASFKQVFVPQLGIVPDMGCTWFVPRLVGRQRAMGMALLGETIPARQAESWGMLWKVVADDQLLDEAMSLARQLAQGPSIGIAELKKALRRSESNTLDQQLDHEADTQRHCCASEDFLEGCMAFAQKRRPVFKGC